MAKKSFYWTFSTVGAKNILLITSQMLFFTDGDQTVNLDDEQTYLNLIYGGLFQNLHGNELRIPAPPARRLTHTPGNVASE